MFSKFLKYLFCTNWIKTIWINFHYFPLKQAIKLPVLISKRTEFRFVQGGVIIENSISFGMFLFGYRGIGTQDSSYDRSIWEVDGMIKLKGRKVRIGRGTKLCVYGELTFGDEVNITGNTTIICKNRIM